MTKEREFKDLDLLALINYRDETKEQLEGHQIECEIEKDLIKELNKEIKIRCREKGERDEIKRI